MKTIVNTSQEGGQTPQHPAPSAASCGFPTGFCQAQKLRGPSLHRTNTRMFSALTHQTKPLDKLKSCGLPQGALVGAVPSPAQHCQTHGAGTLSPPGFEWLRAAPEEHRGHPAASLDFFIKPFVEIHRRAKIKPSKILLLLLPFVLLRGRINMF